MAATVVVCSSVLQQYEQSQEPVMKKRSRKPSVSVDTWICEPNGEKEVQQRAASSSSSSSSSSSNSSFSSCTTQKDSKILSLDMSEKEGGQESDEKEEEEEEVLSRESVCVTPKAKKHRIPVVNIDICPPAPKKPRRLTTACSKERVRLNSLQKLSFSPDYLF